MSDNPIVISTTGDSLAGGAGIGRPRKGEVSVYRIFDSGGRLLYVGIATDPVRRIKEHRFEKSWWVDAATARIERFPGRPAAQAAEKAAIHSEGPLHNVVHSKGEVAVTLKIRCTEDLVSRMTELVDAINASGGARTTLSDLGRDALGAHVSALEAEHAGKLDALRGLRARINGS